jgi:uncharacterized repeat protein (TIGR01451 family)
MDMSNATTRTGSLNGRIGLVALLASVCLVFAAFFGASNAKAAGDPVAIDFNYVGIDVTAALAGNQRLLAVSPAAGIGQLEVRGNYDSGSSGPFTVPKTGGLTFPDVTIPLGPADLEAQIALTEDATGTHDPASGAMTFNPKISLTIGVPDVALLPPEFLALVGGGSGPLRCQLAPLSVEFSTANGWPAPGDNFDTGPGTLENGAIAGAWDVKPNIVAIQGSQTGCDLIGAVLEPVGGLWLAQSDSEITALPDATADKPDPAECPEGFTGTPPDCEEIPPPPAAKVAVSKPKAVAIKRGKSGTVRVTVRNTGGQTASGVRVCGTIPSKIARAPKCVSVGTIAAGSSKAASLRLTVSKRARGKGTLKVSVSSSNAGKASTSTTVTVRR